MKKNNITKLLQEMELIATSLIAGMYITDFTIHDTEFICRTNAKEPFVWFVYNSGTHIHKVNEISEIRGLKERTEYYENHTNSDFCLYRYDGQKLFPVFPKVMREWINNELKKHSL